MIGNKNSELFIYDKNNNRTTITHDDENHPLGRIYGITKDSKNNYWVCSKDHGLFKMTAKAGGGWSLKRYYHSDDDQWSMSANSAYIAIEDKEGNIWVATYGGGVNILTKKDGKEVFLNSNNEMRKYPHKSHLKIRALALDKYGNVWAGSTDGILIMSYKNRQLSIEPLESPADPEQALMCNDVVCLARDKEGNMWVGTMGGGIGRTIGQDKQGRWLFDTFDASSGLPSEEIRSIIFDIHGNAWFGTDHIICSFDTKKNIFTTFSSLDGVDETMLSEGESAAITMGTDKILFGTLDGYYVVDRKKLTNSTGSLLKLRLTDFYLNDELQSPRLNDTFDYYIPESKRVTIPTHSSSFAFRFAALNYQLQHRVHYQYKLEGYDEDWQNAGKDRMATYSNLPSGTYQFQVKAFLLESPENYDMRTIEVVVPASFLLSTKAIWIYLILLTIIALTALWWYQRRLKNGNGNGNANGNESELAESGDVFSEDIKLDVDDTPYADVTEVGMFESEGDDSHLK
jgi:streptogramin lyase